MYTVFATTEGRKVGGGGWGVVSDGLGAVVVTANAIVSAIDFLNTTPL